MQSNGTIVHEYLSNDISRKCPNLPKYVQDQLIELTESYYRREIGYENLIKVFEMYSADTSTPEMIRRVLNIDLVPIRPAYINFPKECVAGRRNRSIPWTEAEDARLIAAIFSMGAKDWRRIAEFVGNNRTSSQCNQRWCRALDPSILHNPWTSDEDSKLLNAVTIIGSKSWCQIAKVIKGRTDLQCRYRYHQLTRYRKDGHSESDPPSEVVEEEEQIINHRKKTNNQVNSFIENLSLDFASPQSKLPEFSMPKYYLESSLSPRKDICFDLLHRIPPLIIKRN